MRRKSGEEIVAEMKMAEEEKREFYVNIARWVDSVSAGFCVSCDFETHRYVSGFLILYSIRFWFVIVILIASLVCFLQ